MALSAKEEEKASQRCWERGKEVTEEDDPGSFMQRCACFPLSLNLQNPANGVDDGTGVIFAWAFFCRISS